MKLNNWFIGLISLFLALSAKAQDFEASTKKQSAWEWVKTNGYVGGGLGAQFGNVTLVSVRPEFGFRITDKWSAGSRLTYQYFRDNTFDYSTSIYGASLLSRYFIFQGLFAMAEYEGLNWEHTLGTRSWVPALFVGGGYLLRMGNNFGLGISAVYDIIQDPRSPYPARQPVLNIGVAVGL